MKLLVVALHHAVATPRYMTDALVRLGHDVRHIGPMTCYFGEDEHPERAWQTDSRDTQHTFGDWTPDLVLFLDCDRDYYHHGGYAGVPHIWYYQDGWMDNDMPGMAHYFHANSDSPTGKRHPDRFTWLPCAYDPTMCEPSPIPFAERAFDVVHVGDQHDRRKLILKELQRRGFKCDIRRFEYRSDYVRAYQHGRVALSENFFNNSVIPRTFEAAAIGNVIVAQRMVDLDKLDPKGLILVDDPDDIQQWVDAVELALFSPDLIPVSQAWAAPHTWDARAQLLLDTCKSKGLVQ